MLKKELQDLEERKQALTENRSALKSGRRAVATVLTHRCGGCGLCTDVCSNHAISVDRYATVDPWLCSACAACVEECPNEAMVIIQHNFQTGRK